VLENGFMIDVKSETEFSLRTDIANTYGSADSYCTVLTSLSASAVIAKLYNR